MGPPGIWPPTPIWLSSQHHDVAMDTEVATFQSRWGWMDGWMDGQAFGWANKPLLCASAKCDDFHLSLGIGSALQSVTMLLDADSISSVYHRHVLKTH